MSYLIDEPKIHSEIGFWFREALFLSKLKIKRLNYDQLRKWMFYWLFEDEYKWCSIAIEIVYIESIVLAI